MIHVPSITFAFGKELSIRQLASLVHAASEGEQMFRDTRHGVEMGRFSHTPNRDVVLLHSGERAFNCCKTYDVVEITHGFWSFRRYPLDLEIISTELTRFEDSMLQAYRTAEIEGKFPPLPWVRPPVHLCG